MRRDEIDLPAPDGYGAAYKPFEQGRAPCIRRFQLGGRMKSCVGELTCIPSHGNAEDSGLCGRCEDAAIEAREAHNAKLRAALHAFADQMPGQMWDYAVTATVSALVRSLNMDGRCRLCGCHNECAPGCAVDLLREVID